MVITYINCSAGMKALSDIICTSSNAQAIVESLPADQPIILLQIRTLGLISTRRRVEIWCSGTGLYGS